MKELSKKEKEIVETIINNKQIEIDKIVEKTKKNIKDKEK